MHITNIFITFDELSLAPGKAPKLSSKKMKIAEPARLLHCFPPNLISQRKLHYIINAGKRPELLVKTSCGRGRAGVAGCGGGPTLSGRARNPITQRQMNNFTDKTVAGARTKSSSNNDSSQSVSIVCAWDSSIRRSRSVAKRTAGGECTHGPRKRRAARPQVRARVARTRTGSLS